VSLTNVEKLVAAKSEGWQELEDTIRACIVGRWVTDAVGVQLDTLGKLVGISRTSSDDEIYRRYIFVQIAINRSQGRTLEIIKVVRLALGDTFADATIRVTTVGPATFRLEIEDALVDDDTAQLVYFFVDRARAAGVRFTLTYSPLTPEEAAAFDDADIGFDDAGFGFGGTI